MEGDAVSATIGVLLQNLIDLSKDEISLIGGLEEDAAKLRDTFEIARSYLDDAESKSATVPAVKTWLKKLEGKAFEAENALDELNYQLISNKNKVPSCFPSFDSCVRRRDLALEIRDINKSFEYIIQTGVGLNLQDNLVAAMDPVVETDSFSIDPIFIGRDDDVPKIFGMLTSPTEEDLSILPIVGMGGLGKTTLVRKVFNHQKTKIHFGQRIWVHVSSQDFDAGLLLKKILKTLQEGNVEVLLKKLKEALKATTYMLVLDDVWNEDERKWEDFINSWLGITSTQGNVILVTTRNTRVGSIVEKTLITHHMENLSAEQCWDIIKVRAFKEGATPPGYEEIGKSIAERCRGLPLAANVVGGVLRGKSQDEWRSIRENRLSEVGGDQNYISRILKLSLDNLSTPSLIKCFAYCSIFPKGARIERVQLIQLWMAEGFLQSSQTSDMETIGNEFVKILMDNSLLNVLDRDEYGEVEHCSIHDIVHDVAETISDVTYYRRDESLWIPKAEARCLRTLIYNIGFFSVVLSNFRSLHSLTLTHVGVRKLPGSIRELIHLRYLNISGTCIRYLPNSIGKLYYLQTIRANNRGFYLIKLPSTLKHLINLRHIYVIGRTKLPPQLGNLTSLQTLLWYQVKNKEGHRISELGSLKNLKGKLEIQNLENVRSDDESEKAYLFQKSGIVRLALMWGVRRDGEMNDVNVLKGLLPPPNLKFLRIHGFRGASFPLWTLKMDAHLCHLTEIIFELCTECEEIPTLGRLPHLKTLTLKSLWKVKSIGASFYGIEEWNSNNGVCEERISVFPSLRRLEMKDMPSLTEWKGVEIPSGAQVEVFPCLEYLKMKRLPGLRSVPNQFTSLKELDIWEMNSSLPLASICGNSLKTLTKLRIRDIEELICLPDWLFHNNQHLSMLEIDRCTKLKELPNGMHNLNLLEELRISDCDNLKSMPFPIGGEKLQGLNSLRTLSIKGCQVVTNFIGEREESCAPLLEYLYIDARGWDSVSSFNNAVDGILQFGSYTLRQLNLRGEEDLECLPNQLQHLTSLKELKLYNFGIEELPEWFGNLSSLKELGLYSCRKLKHFPSVEAMGRLTNLTKLDIGDCPLLKERGIATRSDDVDSEWPKISHIHYVDCDNSSDTTGWCCLYLVMYQQRCYLRLLECYIRLLVLHMDSEESR